jgi:hypothetical protein
MPRRSRSCVVESKSSHFNRDGFHYRKLKQFAHKGSHGDLKVGYRVQLEPKPKAAAQTLYNRFASAASSERKSGCAIAINSLARSRIDLAFSVAIPYSVAT